MSELSGVAGVSKLWLAVLTEMELSVGIERAWTALLAPLYPELGFTGIAARFLEPWRRLIHEQLPLAEVGTGIELGSADLPGWQSLGIALAMVATRTGHDPAVAGRLSAEITKRLLDAASAAPPAPRAPLRLVHSTAGERPGSGLPDHWNLRGDLVGSSQKLRTLTEQCARIARDRYSVLLIGETGSGKEVVARLLHDLSDSAGPFVPVNCAALPEAMIESELFGHARGAFTGAAAQREGLIQAANRGTLLLDELPDLAGTQQAKLLRVLQDGMVRKLGSSRFDPVDVRVVAATSRDPRALIEAGCLRRDLYYRLAVHEIRVPALREHREDVPELAACFLARWSQTNPRLLAPAFDDAAVERLTQAGWPGNVRQLEHTIYHLASLREGGVVSASDVAVATQQSAAATPEDPPGGEETSLLTTERRTVERALVASAGNKAGAARLLGISRKTLYHKIRRHRITADRGP